MDIRVGIYGDKKPKVDLLVAAVFQEETKPPKGLETVDSEAFKVAQKAIQKKRFSGKEGEQFTSYDGAIGYANELLLVGLGKKDKWSREKLRKRTAGILSYGKCQNLKSIHVLAETFASGPIRLEDTAEIISETLDRADYRFDKYLSR